MNYSTNLCSPKVYRYRPSCDNIETNPIPMITTAATGGAHESAYLNIDLCATDSQMIYDTSDSYTVYLVNEKIVCTRTKYEQRKCLWCHPHSFAQSTSFTRHIAMNEKFVVICRRSNVGLTISSLTMLQCPNVNVPSKRKINGIRLISIVSNL